jgi:hypothetical protein
VVGTTRNTGWREASAANAVRSEVGFTSKYGRVMGTSVMYRFSTGAASSGDTSKSATGATRRPRLKVASPAARAFRTQATSPYAATSHHRPPSSTSVMGVEYGWPLVRPRTIRR